jgi:hypothetical protein
LSPGIEPSRDRSRWVWSGVAGAAVVAVLVAVEVHGHSSRAPFTAPRELGALRVMSVGTAADAYAVWEASGLRGRRVVVLTGRWSKPRNLREQPPSAEELAAGADALRLVDADSALFAAAQTGIARRFDVVMPPAALGKRLALVAERKHLQREAEAFSDPYDALERRFSSPRGFRPPAEPVLVLVEPSWFAEGTPADPVGWLRDLGAQVDLTLVALLDPVATTPQRAAANAYATALGAPFAEAPQ